MNICSIFPNRTVFADVFLVSITIWWDKVGGIVIVRFRIWLLKYVLWARVNDIFSFFSHGIVRIEIVISISTIKRKQSLLAR